MASKARNRVYTRIRQILESARVTAARSVNTAQVVANWLIGREIVEDEQRGKRRAEYGEQLLQDLSSRLTAEFGKGFSVDNLELCRRFFLEYPALLVNEKSDALRRKSSTLFPAADTAMPYALRRESWQPGQLHSNLSWTHYRKLLRVDKTEARAFYEIEALKNNWSARELERQINSLLFGCGLTSNTCHYADQSKIPTVTDFARKFPSLCFAFATGVGKT